MGLWLAACGEDSSVTQSGDADATSNLEASTNGDARNGDAEKDGDAQSAKDAAPDTGPTTHATVTSISAGYSHTCALMTSKAVKCWGVNNYGQLGLGDTNSRGDQAGEMGDALPAVDLGTGRTAKAVAAGYGFTCAILDTNALKCWGKAPAVGAGDPAAHGDKANQMGDNLPPVNLGTGRTVKSVAAGLDHACAILDDDTVKCWGAGAYGKLGIGSTSDKGSAPGDMGDSLPIVNLGTGRTAKWVAANFDHTCAVLDYGSVKCWGKNAQAQLGSGDLENRGDQPNEMGDKLKAVNLGTGRTAERVDLGELHTCALLDDESVKCWGNNSFGTLGIDSTNAHGGAASGMGNNLPAAILGAGRTAKSLEAGYAHTCALLDNDLLKCWGNSVNGQLGLGSQKTWGDQAGEMAALPTVDLGVGRTPIAISAIAHHSCALLDDGHVKCWGYNNFGQLGQGDTQSRGIGPSQMGNSLLPIDFGHGP